MAFPFAHLLMGSIYETTGDLNNAFIAYRNAYEVYKRDYVPFFEQESDENVDYVVSSKILTDVQNIFSWLKYTADPNYFKEISVTSYL